MTGTTPSNPGAVTTGRRRGPKPSGRATRTIGVRLYPDEIEALGKLLRDVPDEQTLAGMARRCIVETLRYEGVLKRL